MDQNDKNKNWGGKRDGAGRKTSGNGKVIPRNIGFKRHQLDYVREVSGSSIAKYMRLLLDLDIKARESGIDLAQLVESEISKRGAHPPPDPDPST